MPKFGSFKMGDTFSSECCGYYCLLQSNYCTTHRIHYTSVSVKGWVALTFSETYALRPKKQLSIHCVLSDIRGEEKVKFEHLAHNNTSSNLRAEMGWIKLALGLVSE
jgi:hypothetical protein